MSCDRWIGIHTGGPHYLDHLGVLCAGLEIPLIVSERETFKAAQEFYPDLLIVYRDLPDLSLDFLAERADVIFESGHYFALELRPLWEMLHGKKMRVVYCPHGNSDKNPGNIEKDISLFYGEHMKSLLGKEITKTVRSGNYRSLYYQKHQRQLDKQLSSLLFQDRQTVFYAPTYDASSFSDTARIIEEIAPFYNLWIRWHPFLSELYPAESEKMKALCNKTPNVTDLSSFHSIYPILNTVDFYLGDASSIGYDFLTFNKPLFFLGHHEGKIYECGTHLKESEHWGETIATFQDDKVWAEKRKKLSERVFGKQKSFKEIREELKQALSYNRACLNRT
jgi:hypothetical protein